MTSVNGTFLSHEQTIRLRQEYVAGSCQLHYDRSPLKIVRSSGQFLYDDADCEYLDCTSRVNNVGYCHPETVKAACQQMARLNIDNTAREEYSKQLLATLPANFQTCLFTSSGAEANDLALQLAKRYTEKPGVVVVEGAFHGCSDYLIDISPKIFSKHKSGCKNWVYAVPCPDMLRGKHSTCSDYVQAAKRVIDGAAGQICCFISEIVFVVYGMVVPPEGWLSEIYRQVRAAGGLVIADEIQSGMGRCGSHLWAFQAQGVVPDIITVGKPMGNGHPLAAVITSHRIAAAVDREQYGCGPVEAAVGMSVLRVLRQDHLMENGAIQGKKLKEKLIALMKTRRQIGDVRGLGLLLGVDIVDADGMPDAELAEKISYSLKEEGVLVANEGEYSNVLSVTPPLCITKDDVETIVLKLDKVLAAIELAESQDVYNIINADSPTDISNYHDSPTDISNYQLPSFSSSDDSCEASHYNYYDALD